MKIEFAPAAKTDFKAIVRYIAENNISAASEFQARIMEHVRCCWQIREQAKVGQKSGRTSVRFR